ncbi:hypothetical protein [Clostridium niameyense]|uniref:hypothetical protein n=1 Tax=Clostridium niameyense TaxID=1622073 RepID=UPI00067F1A94|nr:hypothetical protein [Clostridium niameyense]
MKADYKAKKFVRHIYGRKLFGNKTLEFSQSELMHSAIMVGKDSILNYTALGITGELEICYRIIFLFSLLQNNSCDRLTKSVNYKTTFDPTEKAFASYYLGNIFTKLVSTKLLNINQLLHYDLYKSMINTKSIGNRRPDFIGKNNRNEWVLAESKGRSNAYDDQATISGKEQLVGIYSINNIKPSLRYVVQTYFERDVLKLHIEDPEGNKEFNRIFIDEILFEKTYYSLVLKVLSENLYKLKLINFKSIDYYYYQIEDIDIGIGLKKDIYDKYAKIKTEEEIMIKLVSDNNVNFFKEMDYFIGNDGVLIVCKDKRKINELK